MEARARIEREVVVKIPVYPRDWFFQLQQWLRSCRILRLAFDSFQAWRRYAICICKSAAFVSCLLLSYYVVDYAVVDVLTAYYTSCAQTGSILRNAAILKNVHGGLSAIFGAFLIYCSDTYMSRLQAVLLAAACYIIGLLLLAFWEVVPESKFWLLNTIAVFFLAMGKGGLETLNEFLSDQLRAHDPAQNIKEDQVKVRRKVWSFVAWILGGVLIFTFGDHLFDSWTTTFINSQFLVGITGLIFSCGIYFYHSKELDDAGSPLTNIFRVLKAAFKKRHLDNRNSSHQLFQNDEDQSRSMPEVEFFRCLDKAAVIEPSISRREQEKAGTLCCISQVNETKSLLTMFPIWIAVIPIGLRLSTADTFFSDQGDNLEGDIPVLWFFVIDTASGRVISFLYDFIAKKLVDDTSL